MKLTVSQGSKTFAIGMRFRQMASSAEICIARVSIYKRAGRMMRVMFERERKRMQVFAHCIGCTCIHIDDFALSPSRIIKEMWTFRVGQKTWNRDKDDDVDYDNVAKYTPIYGMTNKYEKRDRKTGISIVFSQFAPSPSLGLFLFHRFICATRLIFSLRFCYIIVVKSYVFPSDHLARQNIHH